MRPDKCEISLGILGRFALDLRLFARRKLCLKFVRDLLGKIGLNGKDVGQIAVVIAGPEMLVRRCVDQLHINADTIAGTTDAAFQNGRNAQRFSDFAHVRRVPAIGHHRCP